jgi:hypothetical protein
MIKFFLILAAILAIIFIVGLSVMRFVRRFISNIYPNKNKEGDGINNKSDEILYNKDDVIVLKGEAKSGEEKN